jgi:hypothetical protein
MDTQCELEVHPQAEAISDRNVFENQPISIMFIRTIILLLAYHLSSLTTPITTCHDAQFNPIEASFKLSSVNSWNQYASQCSTNSHCFTGTYFGINQICSLFSVTLRPEWLRVVRSSMNVIVLIFTNKTVPGT